MGKIFDFLNKKETSNQELDQNEEYFIFSLEKALNYIGDDMERTIGDKIKRECLTPEQRMKVNAIKASRRNEDGY